MLLIRAPQDVDILGVLGLWSPRFRPLSRRFWDTRQESQDGDKDGENVLRRPVSDDKNMLLELDQIDVSQGVGWVWRRFTDLRLSLDTKRSSLYWSYGPYDMADFDGQIVSQWPDLEINWPILFLIRYDYCKSSFCTYSVSFVKMTLITVAGFKMVLGRTYYMSYIMPYTI